MIEQPLTINEVLRYVHHDFMNQLQLVKMNLDLERIEAAKTAINDMADATQTFFNINKLGIQKTIEWLHTAPWRFPSLEITIECNVGSAARETWDEALYTYLEQSVIAIYKGIDPLVEQRLSLNIFASKAEFEISFDFIGKTTAEPIALELCNAELELEDVSFSHERWHYCIYAHKEGL
ncbi:Spo0B domain-containing protein [Kurthia massiliensis]|uniref:Spo0B domain-containing protein n=1 Tax=Kurthia massiliensis TaxID=1033739 RepID=UPI000287E186|nr:Spo0B domain-containing protein [Kurthia massiliensis]